MIDPSGLDSRIVAKQVRAATDGGAHASLDALGSQAACEASVRSLRPSGRHVQVGLLIGDDARADIALPRMLGQELSFHGSHGMAAHDYPQMLAEIASGGLDPGRLVGQVITLEEAGAALAAMSARPPQRHDSGRPLELALTRELVRKWPVLAVLKGPDATNSRGRNCSRPDAGSTILCDGRNDELAPFTL